MESKLWGVLICNFIFHYVMFRAYVYRFACVCVYACPMPCCINHIGQVYCSKNILYVHLLSILFISKESLEWPSFYLVSMKKHTTDIWLSEHLRPLNAFLLHQFSSLSLVGWFDQIPAQQNKKGKKKPFLGRQEKNVSITFSISQRYVI